MTVLTNPTFAPGQKVICMSHDNLRGDWASATVTYPNIGQTYTVTHSFFVDVDVGEQEFCAVEEDTAYFDVRDFEPEGMNITQLDAYDRAMSIL